jgi:hypothetical protein
VTRFSTSKEAKHAMRKSLIQSNGHEGHLRNHSKKINLSEEKTIIEKTFQVGWGSNKKDLVPPKDVKCLPVEDQWHKKYWDHEAGLYNIYFTGQHSVHIDAKMGVSFDDIEKLSIRQQREIIKTRAAKMHKLEGMKYKNRTLGWGTKMLDNRLAHADSSMFHNN